MEDKQFNELTKKERKELRHEERIQEKQRYKSLRSIKRVAKIALVIVALAVGIGTLGWYITSRPSIPEGEIISRRGLHWHPELTIFVKDEEQKIPANIGIGAVHNPIHTHDASGVIHLEFSGLVRKDDIKLGRFFEVWGKDFMEFGSGVIMMVNGEENKEPGDYQMKDGDKIELRYQ